MLSGLTDNFDGCSAQSFSCRIDCLTSVLAGHLHCDSRHLECTQIRVSQHLDLERWLQLTIIPTSDTTVHGRSFNRLYDIHNY